MSRPWEVGDSLRCRRDPVEIGSQKGNDPGVRGRTPQVRSVTEVTHYSG